MSSTIMMTGLSTFTNARILADILSPRSFAIDGLTRRNAFHGKRFSYRCGRAAAAAVYPDHASRSPRDC